MRKRIDFDLNEQLFRQWMRGMPLREIHAAYAGTERAFCYRSLIRAKQRYHWDERKKYLVDEYRKNNDQDILIERRKIQFGFSMINDMLVELILRDYRNFLNDPSSFMNNILSSEKKPFWHVNSVLEFNELIKTENDILNRLRNY